MTDDRLLSRGGGPHLEPARDSNGPRCGAASAVPDQIGGEQGIGDPIAVRHQLDYALVPQPSEGEGHRPAGESHAAEKPLGLRMLDRAAARELVSTVSSVPENADR